MIDELIVERGVAELAVRRCGAGPPVLLLHPGVADQRCWLDVADRLSDAHTVISYDRRGFGATTYRAEPHSSADDLAAVLDGVGVERAHLVAASNGGRPALELALSASERVASLTLVAASIDGAPPPSALPDAVERLLDEIDRLESVGAVDDVNELEARLWLDGPSRTAGAVGGVARALFLEMNGRALRAPPTGEVDGAQPDAWSRSDELEMPVLCLAGRHDLPHFGKRMEAMARRVADGTFRQLPNSAHLPQLDDPEGFSDIVDEFLRVVDSSGAAPA